MDNGGPAFPVSDRHPEFGQVGMSLRDYFAAHVDVPWNAALDTIALKKESDYKPTVGEILRYRAQLKILEADAMLDECNRKDGDT